MSTSTTKKTTRPQAFTLIELLVVISIIAILASLAFPAIGGAMDSARKTTAKNSAVQIANAVVAYETEYGRLPTNSGGIVNGDFMKILTANDSTNNPRAVVFLEAQAWKKGKGGTNTAGDYCDPWSNTNIYSIALDSDYDNKIDVSTNGTPSGTFTITRKVGVWNLSTNPKYRVNSWD